VRKSVESGVSSVGSVVQKAKGPALVGTAAAAGIAGGVALGSRLMSARRSPARRFARSGVMKTLAQEASNVGREVRRQGVHVGVGNVSMDVQRRNGTQKQRRSPIEVVLQGLTERRQK
jgi:hypothetical protein